MANDGGNIPFDTLTPELIFTAAERLGGRATGRFFQLNAMENRVYDVGLEDGSAVVVKFYRPGRWSRAMIEAEHRFLLDAVAAEIPVVAPKTNEAGQSLHDIEVEGGHVISFAVFPKRAGRLEPELNTAQLERLGRYLARLHQLGRKLRGLERWRLNIDTFAHSSLADLRRLNVLPPSVEPRFAELVTNITNIIEPGFPADSGFTLIHGDCHVGNILWRDAEPLFIDFDDMLFGPPVQDMWMLMGGDDEHALQNLSIIIKEYQTIERFDVSSIRWIEALRALRMIYYNAWIGRRYNDGAFKRSFPQFGTERYWQSQIEDLSFQLEKLRDGRGDSYLARVQEFM